MRLNEKELANSAQWENAGYFLPQYDRKDMMAKTKSNPFWLHFGAGNIFRAFPANTVQTLLNNGVLDRGLIAVSEYEAVEKVFRPSDNYSILVTLKADGSIDKTVVGSIAESLTTDPESPADFDRLKEIIRKDSLQMVSFTITEKGYLLTDSNGALLPAVAADMEKGPEMAESYMGKVAALLYQRYLAGAKPIAMVSMDNFSHNGTQLYNSIAAFAKKWSADGLTEKNFADYISHPAKVSFPWSMIDKITPRPDPSVVEILKKDGVEGAEPFVTGKNTYIATFVNAEECEYLVIEDNFPNGRPPLEKGGFMFTPRETVDKVEKMKVCTCLNPLHTALAVFGCLLGYTLISDEMKDETLRKLAEGIGYKEGLPVVVHPGILNPEDFLDAVLNIRLPNPFMPDTPQRIATDTSQKLAIRFGETIKAYAASPVLNVADLKLIPLVFAGWLRYLMAVDDNGAPFDLSPDPLMDSVRPVVADLRLGDDINAEELLTSVLKNEKIFGVNLYEVNMAPAVCRYFTEMISGKGAVRDTLKKYVG